MKFCSKADANLFSLACELFQGKKISSDHQNNIVVESTNCNNILDCCIKAHDGWVARVEFLCETNDEKAHFATSSYTKNINDLHSKLGHPSKSITHATAKAIGIQVTSTFKPC